MSRTVLIDTHILLWASADPDKLTANQRAALEDPACAVMVSAVSAVEIEIKRAIGKLEMDHTCDDLRDSIGAQWLPLTGNHAMRLRSLPSLHRDPFDRMLIAQAITEGIELVTSDHAIGGYAEAGLRVVG